MSFLSLRSGTLTTFFYDSVMESTELDGIFPCVKRKYDEVDHSHSDGMIYVFGSGSLGKFALDGDEINGKTVRKQELTIDGFTYVIGKIRPVYSGGQLHHLEIGVI